MPRLDQRVRHHAADVTGAASHQYLHPRTPPQRRTCGRSPSDNARRLPDDTATAGRDCWRLPSWRRATLRSRRPASCGAIASWAGSPCWAPGPRAWPCRRDRQDLGDVVAQLFGRHALLVRHARERRRVRPTFLMSAPLTCAFGPSPTQDLTCCPCRSTALAIRMPCRFWPPKSCEMASMPPCWPVLPRISVSMSFMSAVFMLTVCFPRCWTLGSHWPPVVWPLGYFPSATCVTIVFHVRPFRPGAGDRGVVGWVWRGMSRGLRRGRGRGAGLSGRGPVIYDLSDGTAPAGGHVRPRRSSPCT